MNARGALGKYGENLAARQLVAAGMKILDRNWRSGPGGEIDIVALDHDTLVLCEVKTRRGHPDPTHTHQPFQHPMAAITPAKADRLRTLAGRWLHQHGGPPPGGVRIDLIGILLPSRGAPVVEHVQGVA
ncbi:YraN family protein [Streptomyces cavernicola]|uniref:UPF0102 protein QIS96_19910 n=1 Tax=Streptomyces cavernicola TaxID=3043613 RepID=A0ABT6SDQ6_9ACTN|nr:YraN family protein [Streptomyces sp. B-S-A6]MDI3406074.1 YraN family protein [Streptomyces sp. B-S-A6]